jgi:hypothetical protein
MHSQVDHSDTLTQSMLFPVPFFSVTFSYHVVLQPFLTVDYISLEYN